MGAIMVLGIVFVVCVWISYLIHEGRNDDINGFLKKLNDMEVSLPPKEVQNTCSPSPEAAQSAQTVRAITLIDLDQQLDQVQRGRNLMQIGLLILAGIAVVAIAILAKQQAVFSGRQTVCMCESNSGSAVEKKAVVSDTLVSSKVIPQMPVTLSNNTPATSKVATNTP